MVQVLEGRHVFPHMTVEQNLVTGGFHRQSGRKQLESGRIAVNGTAAELNTTDHVKTFYLGIGGGEFGAARLHGWVICKGKELP